MNKKSVITQFALVLFVLLILVTPNFSASFLPNFNITTLFNINHNQKPLNIRPINPTDDAFHGTTPFPSVEWWYFDSMLNQNYSVHVGFKIFTFYGFELLTPTINIYHDRQLIVNETNLVPHTSFTVSEEYPELKIKNDPVMFLNKTRYEQSGEWIYHVSCSLNDVSVDLTFSSETKGWYYETAHEGWTVAVPQGKVEGFISLHDQKIPVHGRGYHDHNWNFSLETPIRGWSWYWGKITGETLNLAWAEIKETGILEQTFSDKLGVLNIQKDTFIVIDPQNISFSAGSFLFKDNRFIPTVFDITIQQDDVYVDVSLKAEDIHRSDPSIATLHYWRYFVTVTGVISYNDTTEYINEKTQIMEYMRFI